MKPLGGAELENVASSSLQGLSPSDLLDRAIQGNPWAQIEVGRGVTYARNGGKQKKSGFARNNVTARLCFEVAAEQTAVPAAAAVAMYEILRMDMLGLGGGPGKLKADGDNWASKPDQPQHHVGIITRLFEASQANIPAAIHCLGTLYNSGYKWDDATGHSQGIKVDRAKAARHFNQAASLGFDEAQYNMAKLYEFGDPAAGIKKDQTKAFGLYSAAAEQGHAGARLRIAKCFEYGQLGQKPNTLKAHHRYTELVNDAKSLAHDPLPSTRRAYAQAYYQLGLMHDDGIPGVVGRNPVVAFDLYFESILIKGDLSKSPQDSVEKAQDNDLRLRYAALLEQGHGKKWGLGSDVAEIYYDKILRNLGVGDPMGAEAGKRLKALRERGILGQEEEDGYLITRSANLKDYEPRERTEKNTDQRKNVLAISAFPRNQGPIFDTTKVEPDKFVPAGLAAAARLG